MCPPGIDLPIGSGPGNVHSTLYIPSRTRGRRTGLALIEFALALPLLILVLAGIVQFAGLFYIDCTILNLARDCARRVAVGSMAPGEVQSFVQARFGSWPDTFTVSVHVPDPNVPSAKDVIVEIRVPFSEASLMDILGLFQQGDLTASVTMLKE